MKNLLALSAIFLTTALASSAAMAQTTAQPKGPDVQPGETSDRTPGQKTEAPLTQKDAYKGETSDRTPDTQIKRDPSAGGVKPDHEGTPGGMPKKSN